MKIICEDKCGHPIEATPWVDAYGNLRLVVQNFCPICDNLNIQDEAKERAEEMLKDMGITRARINIIEIDDPVEDLLN